MKVIESIILPPRSQEREEQRLIRNLIVFLFFLAFWLLLTEQLKTGQETGRERREVTRSKGISLFSNPTVRFIWEVLCRKRLFFLCFESNETLSLP